MLQIIISSKSLLFSVPVATPGPLQSSLNSYNSVLVFYPTLPTSMKAIFSRTKSDQATSPLKTLPLLSVAHRMGSRSFKGPVRLFMPWSPPIFPVTLSTPVHLPAASASTWLFADPLTSRTLQTTPSAPVPCHGSLFNSQLSDPLFSKAFPDCSSSLFFS